MALKRNRSVWFKKRLLRRSPVRHRLSPCLYGCVGTGKTSSFTSTNWLKLFFDRIRDSNVSNFNGDDLLAKVDLETGELRHD